jgi:3-isopropylmalate dehydrogenase
VVTEVAREYPDCELEHMLADNCAMQLVESPEQFDVIVTENMFGDILSDEAAAVTGGLGLAGSASLSDRGPGLFEPVHGSAPDIAGRGIANPVGMLRSTALMLSIGLERIEEGKLLEAAIDSALGDAPTADLGGGATTSEYGDAVLSALQPD